MLPLLYRLNRTLAAIYVTPVEACRVSTTQHSPTQRAPHNAGRTVQITGDRVPLRFP